MRALADTTTLSWITAEVDQALEFFARALRLGGVTHVRERELCAGLAEDASEHQRVVVVRGVVVGDDRVWCHHWTPVRL